MRTRFFLMATAAAAAIAPAAQAKGRTDVTPYLEVDQTVLADLKNGGDTQTYTTLAAGIDASIRGPRAEGQISYRYEYRYGWGKRTGDSQVHSGLARGAFEVVPGTLTIEGGAIATRLRTDNRGSASNLGLGSPSNVSQLYSAYVGPTLATRVGELNVGAYYRLGYSKVESKTNTGLPGGSAVLDSFDHSVSQSVGASVGMKSGTLPFGWTISGGYYRDDAGQLDGRLEGKLIRGDVTVPVTPTVAIVGGVGYEHITASQRDALRDVNGIPVVANGRFVTDPASPRLLSYDQSGFIWDTGVLWRPSRRTSLEARVGRRYGSMTYTGAFSWAPTADQAVQIGVYDGVTTFGRQLNDGLSRLPTRFVVQRDPFDNQFGGCVFGGSGGGAGDCLSPALQSVASGVFRSRGVQAVWSYSHGRISGGVAVGYNNRKFSAPPVGNFAIRGVIDESYFAQAFVARKLSENSGVEGSIYANLFDSGVLNAPRVLGLGATGSYYRNFTSRLSGSAAVGLYSNDVDGVDSTLIGAAQAGLRYSF